MKRLNEQELDELRTKLPRGSAPVIQRRLQKHYDYSLQYVYQCLNPRHHNYSERIINEAIALLAEVQRKEQKQEKQINRLFNKLKKAS